MDSAHEYVTHRALIERTIQSLVQRYRMSQADAEDFASTVHVRLMADNCAILREFRGRSALTTYLFSVIRHLLQDWRDGQWGRWRPSIAARRAGPVAAHLETLLARDGLSLDEAIEMLRTNHGVTETPEALRALAGTLPRRPPRTMVSADVLVTHPSNDTPDRHLEAQDAMLQAARIDEHVDAALARLSPQDQLILRLRFEEGLRIPAISRMVGESDRRLYGRVTRLLAGLRRDLEARGLSAATVADVLDSRGFDGRPHD